MNIYNLLNLINRIQFIKLILSNRNFLDVLNHNDECHYNE